MIIRLSASLILFSPILVALSRSAAATSIEKRAVVTSNIPLADGSYCFQCKPDSISNAGKCGIAAFQNLLCFQDAALDGQCGAGNLADINLTSFDLLSPSTGRVCVDVGRCLNLCAVANADSLEVDYNFCCFKLGSVCQANYPSSC